jgi:class 3 adenylate cyclase/tetratricopeptide (TPR) repeat protein
MAEDLGRWLADLGLGRYAEAFAANGVDWDVLADLSEKDLESLGLLLGDRKRLMRAIAVLDGDGSGSAGTPPARRMVDGAERRQITVMFVDLVGSTPLSERLDPEDMRELLQDFHALCAAAVEAQSGHVARYMGDGILVYFGYPQAHEDDAARAIHAGLGILESLRSANERPGAQDVRLSVRIGIYTGLVVVGEVGAGPARDQDAITGETPNIANRVQTEAAADTIVIGDATQRLVDGQFDLEDLGPRRLKGVSNPIRLYRVLGESGAVDRFTLRARTRRAMTPLVGREAELEMVRRRWRQANDGEMRCVLLVGDAGIGKSRLLRALRDGLRGEPYKFLPMFCTSNHANSAFWPVLDWFRRTLRLGAPSRAHTAAAMLGRMVKPLDLDMAEAMPILEAFLDLPGDESYRPADTAVPSFRRQLIDILVKMFGAMARGNPLLFAVEDAHWIDPSTLELLQQLQEQLPAARLMLLVTARPTFKPGWSYPQFVQINLDRLSRRERTVMVERLVGDRTLPEPVVAEIVAKTDGIPLFVEELTKAVLEGSVLRDSGDAYEVVGSLQAIAIPDTLQGSLMARLDRLDAEAREVAQIGATIGREFSTSLLSRLAGRSDDDLDAALARLVAEEIVVPATVESFAGPSHVFRHVLIQEAAYQSLLLTRRRQYHAAIAEAIEAHFPEIAAMQPETIAQHWTFANRVDEAIDWWRRAGERAVGRSAYLEACVHFQRGLELAERQPGDDRSRYRRTLPLLLARGDAEFKSVTLPAQATYLECANIARQENLPSLMVEAAIRYADSEVYLAVSSATSVALLEEMLVVVGEDTLDRCRVLSRLAKALLSTGQTERGREVLRQARQITARLNDRRSLYEVLVSDLMPNAGPPPCGAAVEERRQALGMIWEIAQGFESMRKLEALTRSGAGYLEIGDIDGFERGLHRQREIARTSHADFDRWIVANGDTIHGIVLGTFAAAERASLEALKALSGHDVDFPLGIHGMQMFTIRREQGRLAEVAPLVKRFVHENPDNAIWRPGLMLVASDLGFEAQARRTFEAMAESGFTLPLDSKRAVTLTYLAEVCAQLGDSRRAAELHELLLPYRDLAVVVPVHGLCCGAAARYLGILATTMQDWPSAERHFESALATDEKMKAWPWLAHTRHEYAAMLLARGRPQDKVRASELRGMSLAAADRLGMARLRRRLLGTVASA